VPEQRMVVDNQYAYDLRLVADDVDH